MAKGTVLWFNRHKGYGFIEPDGGGDDIFVHISAVQAAGYDNLVEGARISYEVVSARGRRVAEDLRGRRIGYARPRGAAFLLDDSGPLIW